MDWIGGVARRLEWETAACAWTSHILAWVVAARAVSPRRPVIAAGLVFVIRATTPHALGRAFRHAVGRRRGSDAAVGWGCAGKGGSLAADLGFRLHVRTCTPPPYHIPHSFCHATHSTTPPAMASKPGMPSHAPSPAPPPSDQHAEPAASDPDPQHQASDDTLLPGQTERFLKHPAIREAPREKKVAFLESKGVTPEVVEELMGTQMAGDAPPDRTEAGERAWPTVRAPDVGGPRHSHRPINTDTDFHRLPPRRRNRPSPLS